MPQRSLGDTTLLTFCGQRKDKDEAEGHRLEVDRDSEGGAAVDVPCKGAHDLRCDRRGYVCARQVPKMSCCIALRLDTGTEASSDLLVLRQDNVESVKP